MTAIDEMKKKREAKEAKPEDLPLVFAALAELSKTDEEIKAVVGGMDDMALNFKVAETGIAANLQIKGGKISGGSGLVENADATIQMTPEVAAGMVTGEADTTAAYMAGDMTVEGDMSKVMSLRTLTDAVGEKVKS